MPPLRRTTTSDPSSSKALENRQRKSKRSHPKNEPASDALPGVQKIKAALRQTRRLLAKDTIAADVRVATERRLRSLEGDLANAEQARLERTMATRYHRIKFFERQKVTRKLAQTKKQLAEAGKKDRRKLEAQLADLRVDLNYIIHYPKTKKYISLFPPEARQGKDVELSVKEVTEESETDRQREEVRQWVRAQMDSGALSLEPEVELESTDRKLVGAVKPTSTRTRGEEEELAGDGEKARPSEKRARGAGVLDDEFFALDEEEEVYGGNRGNGVGDSEGEDSENED